MMGCDDDSDAGISELFEDIIDHVGMFWIKCGKRFVQNQKFRLHYQNIRDGDPLFLSTAQKVSGFVQKRGNGKSVTNLCDTIADGGFVQPQIKWSKGNFTENTCTKELVIRFLKDNSDLFLRESKPFRE